MRYIYAFLLVVSFVFVGCSGSHEQLEPKSVSDFNAVIEGTVTWEISFPIDLPVSVYSLNGAGDLGTFLASPAPPDYQATMSLDVPGGTYIFTPNAPPGYSASPGSYVRSNVGGQATVLGIDFLVEAD